MGVSLYELTEGYKNIANLIDTEAPDESLMEALKTIEESIEQKAGNIALLIQNIDADINALKAEEERLAGRRKSLENKKTWFKLYLQENFKAAGLDKVKTATHTISLQNNPPRVNILDMSQIPDTFRVIVPEDWIPNKISILESIKGGQEVAGAEIVQTQSIRIR